MEEDEINTGEQSVSRHKTEHLAPWQYKKGQSGNPSGRAKGISMKEYLRKNFIHMTDDEREEYFNGISKIDLLKMAEGNPDTKQDFTVREVPIPIDDVQKDNSISENKEAEQKN